jgi:cytochrome d ubiquinol oxidase subunit I
MILAAFMVTGFGVASVYAVGMLRGRSDRYHRLGLLVPFTGAAVITPIQIVVGDWAARMVSDDQPAKLATMEGLVRTMTGAPEALGGYFNGQLHDALLIPYGLSLLAKLNPHATIKGLDAFPSDDVPSAVLVTLVHLSFDAMVIIGFALLALGLWLASSWWRRHDLPRTRWFLRAVALSGIAATVAMELGWIVTEVGRQPWIVYWVMRVPQAVNPEPGIQYGFYSVVAIYAVLTVVTVLVLLHLRSHPRSSAAPQEPGEPRT